MLNCFVAKKTAPAISIIPLNQHEFNSWITSQPEHIKNQIATLDFKAAAGTYQLLINEKGRLEQVILGVEDHSDYLPFGMLAAKLPANTYTILAPKWEKLNFYQAAIGWGLGSYKFLKYKKIEKEKLPQLELDSSYEISQIDTVLEGIFLVRDLINTPANDMTPAIFAATATAIAKKFGAKVKQIVGADLLTKNFPAIYTVGRASSNEPYLVEIEWNSKLKNAPAIALVGKGICFDSGGLDIKNPANMFLMKKDMAGAAHALGLAQMIMASNLPVKLRVILPLAENLVAGNSFKPGDVIKTRKGVTVEVRDTDAEGRLILADALTYAAENKPDLLIDFATLTGAARMALGSEVAALFTPNDVLAANLIKFTQAVTEHVWRLPLHKPYLNGLKSKIADLSNLASSVQGAGAIIAALFLQEFVPAEITWAHFDMTAYNFATSPGKPEGGEAMCLQGIFNYLIHHG